MSDETEKQNEDAAAGEPQGPVGGERLSEARREQQISVLEIAKELHLDEPKVRALERNEFDTLGAPVFAKGHMRKYAQLVGVDEGDMLKDYYELTRSASMPPVISVRPRPRREMSPGPWIAVIVVIIIAATIYWWLTTRPAAVEESELLPELEEPQQEPPQEEAPAANVGVDDTLALEPEAARPEIVQVATTPAADPAPPLAEGELRLLVTYSGDCWTEISDASGRRLFFDLGKSGRTVELSGVAPFNVLFGNAENVSLEVNGAEYAIGATERRGRTARFTISGT